MLSLETAKKLKDAGLKWEPDLGDWAYLLNELGDAITVELWTEEHASAYEENILDCDDSEKYKDVFNESTTWLPCLDQLLAEIEARGYAYDLNSKKLNGQGQYLCWVVSGNVPVKKRGLLADSSDEATAQALLWILEKEEDALANQGNTTSEK